MKALIVDGYNAIHKIKDLESLLDKSLYEARKALTQLALDYQQKIGGIAKVYVVFDGRDAYRDLLSEPHQVFSGTGEGDSKIIRMVNNLSGRYNVIVASDDNFVRNNSRAYGAGIITIREFFAAARKRKAAKTACDTDEDKIMDPASAQEITEYLKKRIT